MNFFKKKKAGPAMPQGDELDETLYAVSGTNVAITYSNALESTLIFGAAGGGRSNIGGAKIAKARLGNHYGMCALYSNPEEREAWKKYIKDRFSYKD